MSYTRGAHSIKFGVDFNFDRIFNFFSGLFTGQYTFNSYALFAANSPSAYTQNFAGPGTDRVPGTLRNEFTTPNIYIFDTRATKHFTFAEKYRLSLIVEAFNLFNRSNLATVNTGRYGIASSAATTLTNPAAATPFGGPRTFLGERQVQFAVRFAF